MRVILEESNTAIDKDNTSLVAYIREHPISTMEDFGFTQYTTTTHTDIKADTEHPKHIKN